MRVTKAVADRAFQEYARSYGTKWPPSERLGLYRIAAESFNQRGKGRFKDLYDELGTEWQVFARISQEACWSPEKTLRTIESLPTGMRETRLTELSSRHVSDLLDSLSQMSGIKRLKTTTFPEMAVSKFLHFWNPHLFVIVDGSVMRSRVLAHRWAQTGICEAHRSIGPHISKSTDGGQARYISTLFWCSQILRRSESIMSAYRKFVRTQDNRSRAIEYEATAVEWFLIGADEIPPWDAPTV